MQFDEKSTFVIPSTKLHNQSVILSYSWIDISDQWGNNSLCTYSNNKNVEEKFAHNKFKHVIWQSFHYAIAIKTSIISAFFFRWLFDFEKKWLQILFLWFITFVSGMISSLRWPCSKLSNSLDKSVTKINKLFIWFNFHSLHQSTFNVYKSSLNDSDEFFKCFGFFPSLVSSGFFVAEAKPKK